MVDRGTLLARLALGVAGTASDRPLAARLCEACVPLLEADGAALTLGYTSDQRVTLCTTDAMAERLEDLQEVLGEGPGRDAHSSGYRVSVRLPAPELARWPMLSAALLRQSVALAVLALPLQSGASTFGVLTVHRDTSFRADDQDAAQFVADAVAAAILRDQQEEETASAEPWQRRSRVHLATGMVVAQLRLAPEDALAIIRAHAFAQDMSINEVAEEIVARRLRLGSSPEGDHQP